MAANPTVVEASFEGNENLRYEQIKKAVNLSLTDKPLEKGAVDKAQLFALSNTYGYFVAGISDGFVFDKLSNLRDAFEQGAPDEDNMFSAATKVVLPENSVRFIRLSADELTVVVALKGGQVQLYSAASLLNNRKGAKPEATLSLGAEIRDIRPNPAVDRNGLAAVLFENKTLKMVQMDGAVVASIDKHKYTAISWSAKGKQIMCGTDTGRLCQFDPAGTLKKEHLPDSENEGNAVLTVNWIETAVFVVAYASPADGSVNVCAISREDPSAPKITKFIELCFPDQDTPFDAKGYIMSPALKAWGGDNKDVMAVTSYAANDISSIGKTATGEWAELDLDDTGRPLLPDFDGICVGMGLDLTSTKKLPPREEEGPEVPACPVLYMLNENGRLAGYHIIHVQSLKAAQPYPGMVSSKPIPGATAPAASSKSAGPSAKVATAPTVAPAAPTSSKASFTAPAAPKAAFQTTNQTFGSSLTLSNQPRASPASIPPNPVVNRNPSFQQSKPVAPKASNEMQKILDEKEVPAKINRSKAVDEEPSAPVPKVSTAMDALSRHLEQTYQAMTDELKTLHSHVRETEELVKAREHVFFELDKFRDVVQKRIHTAQNTKSLAESVLAEFVSLRADLIKVTNKKEEVGKLLKARLDPDLHQMVMASELNPAQLSKQEHMKRSFDIVDGRLRELEDYVEALNAKASKMRQGHDAEGPTLDSIRRTIRNISGTLLSRQADLDQLSDELNQLAISDSLNPAADSSARVAFGTSSASTKPRKRFDLSASLSSLPDQRSSTKAKEDVAFLLRRVFTSNKQARPLLTDLGRGTQDKALSVLPRVETTDFTPATEPRRLETKKQLSAAIPAQTEPLTVGSASGFAPPPTSFATSTSAATPFASAQKTTPMSSLGSNQAQPSFSAPQPMFSFAKPTASPASTTGSPFFSSSASTAPAQQAFGTSPVGKQAGFAGFNLSAPSSSPAPTATTTSSWGVPQPAGAAPKAFTGFQLPKAATPAFTASTQPSLVTPPSTEQPSKWKEAEDAGDGDEDEVDDDHRAEQEEEEEEEYQEEYADDEGGDAEDAEYDQNYSGKGRYEHDGQTYDLGEGSETDTWGSEADQRDYDDVGGDYEDEDAQDDGEDAQDDDEEHEEPAEDEEVAAIKDGPKTLSKSAWAAPGFSFPATGPKGSEAAPTLASSESSKPAFSFFTAAGKNAKEPEVASKPQSVFGTASSSNTFGSTASFAFGAPSDVANPTSAFASKSLFGASKGQEDSKASESVVKTASPAAFTAVTGAQALRSSNQEQDSDDNDRSSAEDENNSDAEDEQGRFEDQRDGSSEDERAEADDGGDDSDKESALTAIQVGRSERSDENRRSSTSSRESFSLVEKTSQLEESDLDLSKAGLGSRPRDVTSLSSSFGTLAADSLSDTLASDIKAAAKVVDAPFVKPPRRRKESRDSLDSNTTDEEDNAASDNDGSPVQRGRDTMPAPLSGFGSLNTKAAAGGHFDAPFVKPPRRRKESRDSMDSNTTAEEDSAGSDNNDSPAPRIRDTTPAPMSGFGSLETKGNAGALDSFSLSLGGGDQDEKPKPTWGSTSTTSSWGNVSQTSAPTVGWGSTASLGVSGATTAAPASGIATTSTFGSQPSTLTSAPTSWGSGGSAFGQTATLGTGFGQTSAPGTGFGQSSASGTGFGQTSTPGTGFGQTSTPGTGFGQTSTPGTGFGQTSTPGTGFGQTSAPGTGFGQTSTPGTGFGQTSTPGTGFGQTSTLGSGFGQTSSLGSGGSAFSQAPAGGSAFGQTSSLGGGTAFGQTAQLGGTAFGQTAFGQPSQISGGFGKPQANAFATAATQSNFSNFASSNTNAFAALAQSGTNVLDQSASQGGGFGNSGSGGSAFGTGGGFGGDSASSVFGSGGGFGGSNNTTSGFGGGSTFGGSSTSGSGGFGTGGGFGAAQGGMGSGQSVFGSSNQQQSGGFGQPAQQQGGFGTGFGNVDRSKPSFSGFR